jgi:hypothetical protein
MANRKAIVNISGTFSEIPDADVLQAPKLIVTAGAVGAPSLAIIGDTNTGIYSPGADTLSISVGGIRCANFENAAGTIGSAFIGSVNFTSQTDPLNDGLLIFTHEDNSNITDVLIVGPNGGTGLVISGDENNEQIDFWIADAALASLTKEGHLQATGALMTKKVAAPADAEIDTSELSIWFDDNTVTHSLRIKAKDSGGTVRTATIPLA